MSIQLTERAAKEIKALFDREGLPGESAGLRIGVKDGGCSGFSYALEFALSPEQADEIIEAQGVRIFLDPAARLYLLGTTVDYESSLTESGFRFRNPNAQRSCGCGKSFGV